MRKTLALLGLTALLFTGAAGCTTPTPTPPAAPPAGPTIDEPSEEATPAAPAALPDPCALVTKDDAETLAATPLDDAVAVRETCTYSGPVTGPTAQVEIYVGDGAKKILDIDRELGHEFTEVAGVGDEAYLENGMIFFSRSGTWVGIRLVRFTDDAENNRRLEQAARTAAGRL